MSRRVAAPSACPALRPTAKIKAPGARPGASHLSSCGRSVPGDDRAGAEFEVEAALHDALALVDVDVDERHGREGEWQVLGAEVVVVVLDEAGEPIQEGIFAADAHRPAGAGLVGGQHRAGQCRNDVPGVIVLLPGPAALKVEEKPVPAIAQAAGHRAQRLGVRAEDRSQSERIDMAAVRFGPGIVALDADHETAGELIIAARLHAGDPAAGVMAAEVGSRNGDAYDRGRGDVLGQPQTAAAARDIAAGPAAK